MPIKKNKQYSVRGGGFCDIWQIVTFPSQSKSEDSALFIPCLTHGIIHALKAELTPGPAGSRGR